MPSIASYTDADTFLHTRGKPVARKKLQNNTYAVRQEADIAIVLHDTAVVTYHDNGTLSLNTGGWLTVTTKERINEYTPPNVRISSVKGRWVIAAKTKFFPGHGTGQTWDTGYVGTDWSDSVPFAEGVVLTQQASGRWEVDLAPTESAALLRTVKGEDRHNDSMRKLITRFLKTYTGPTDDFDPYDPADLQSPSCTLCALRAVEGSLVSIGVSMGDTQHLIDHLLDRECPGALLYAAIAKRGYRNPAIIYGDYSGPHPHLTIHKRLLRSHLTGLLFRGAVASQHGRHPIAA